MKRMPNVPYPLRDSFDALQLLGEKGRRWLLVRILFSLAYVGTEYGITLLLIVFLFTLKLVPTSQIPTWMPQAFLFLPPAAVWATMLVIGILRGLSQLISKQAGHAALEFVRARLKMIQGFEILIVEKEHATSLSDVGMRMTEFIPKASDYIYHGAEMISTGLQSLALIAGMLLLTWQETLTGISFLGLVGIIVFQLNRLLSRISVWIPEQNLRLERSIVRICKNWLLIRVLHIQHKEYESYLDSVLRYFQLSTRAFYYGNISSVAPPLFGIVILVMIIFANFTLFQTPALDLVAFIYLFFRFTQSAVMITDHLGYLHRYRVHFKEVTRQFKDLSAEEITKATKMEASLTFWAREMMAAEIPTRTVQSAYSEEPIASSQPPDIKVNEITFQWPGGSRKIFQDFSLSVKAGSQFGIIGPNGSGKSTLLGLILGVLQPTSGAVLLGNIDCRDYVKHSKNIGYVSDDPYLFLGTIRENLLYGAERDITDADLIEALQKVGMEADIMENPRGLDASLREDGEGLSSGQMQRLALARAFLRKPTLLILDEASANLDRAVELEIATILKELKDHCTTLIVSHKPGILKYADEVIDLGAYRIGS